MHSPILAIGAPVPWIVCASSANPKYHLDTIAGRYLVLCFFGSMKIEKNARAVRFLTQDLRSLFDDENFSFFGITVDAGDVKQERIAQDLPGIRYFHDFDRKVSETYGAMRADALQADGSLTYRSFTLVVDPTLRLMAHFPLNDAEEHNKALETFLKSLPPAHMHAAVPVTAPVLVAPRILEPELCRELIAYYHTHGGQESGFMREKDGKTVGIVDHGFKKRMDCQIEDESLRARIRDRIALRLVPEIKKAFQFNATHIERYIVACYDAGDGGFFRPHRDNTTKGTAHRRFACTINLNAEEYEGGELRFPEYGPQTYRAPTGGGVVFSCSLLHEATPVTKGTRYATLPFLYDEAASIIRRENAGYIVNADDAQAGNSPQATGT